mgnify:CR=1 FL=1
MALTKSITLQNNFGEDSIFANAYIKVRSVNVAKKTAEANIDICKEQGGLVIQRVQYAFEHSLTGDNPIKQAYLHLKTLPEFSDAVDC